MKKVFFAVVLVLCLALCSCGSSKNEDSGSEKKDSSDSSKLKTPGDSKDGIDSYAVSGNIIYYVKDNSLSCYNIETKQIESIGGNGEIFATPFGVLFVDNENASALEGTEKRAVAKVPEGSKFAAFDGEVCYFLKKDGGKVDISCCDINGNKAGYAVNGFEVLKLYPDEKNLWIHADNTEATSLPMLLCVEKNKSDKIVEVSSKDAYFPEEKWGYNWFISQGKKGILAANDWNVNMKQTTSHPQVYYLTKEKAETIFPSGGNYFTNYSDEGFVVLNEETLYLVDENTGKYRVMEFEKLPVHAEGKIFYNNEALIVRGFVNEISFYIYYENRIEEVRL